MAYQAKRNQKYEEDFELVDEKGTIVHRLHVSLDVDSMAEKLSKKHAELLRAQREIAVFSEKREPETWDGQLEELGRMVGDILSAVFGEEDAKTIIKFYRGRYTELMREVLPFVTQIVVPRVREMAQEQRKQLLQSYNRKQKRGLFKGLG